MSEPLPDDATEDTTAAETDPPAGLAARLGEKILGIGEFFSRRTVSLLSREEAVWQGFGSVLGRLFAGAGLLFLCWLLGTMYGFGISRLSRIMKITSSGGIDGALLVIVGLSVAGAAMIFFWNDWERKWRVLSWLCFVLVAVWTLLWSGNHLLQGLVLTGQFAVHWLIHTALRERDRREEQEQEIEAEKRRAARVTERRLQEKYRGHSGFSEGPDDETKAG